MPTEHEDIIEDKITLSDEKIGNLIDLSMDAEIRNDGGADRARIERLSLNVSDFQLAGRTALGDVDIASPMSTLSNVNAFDPVEDREAVVFAIESDPEEERLVLRNQKFPLKNGNLLVSEIRAPANQNSARAIYNIFRKNFEELNARFRLVDLRYVPNHDLASPVISPHAFDISGQEIHASEGVLVFENKSASVKWVTWN